MLSATNAFPGLEDVLLPVAADGQLGQPRTVAQEFYAFSWDPVGWFFYGLDGEAIFQFRFDAGAGNISVSDPARADGSDGRVVLALRHHPNGRWVYSVEERELGQYSFNPVSGVLANRQFVQNPIATDSIYWTAIALHPEGRFLYALGYLDPSRLALVDLFRIDPADGRLTFVKREKGPPLHQVQNRGLQAPLVLRDLLLVGGPGVATSWGERALLSVYKIDPGDGTLTAVGQPTPLNPPGAAVNFIFGE
jgi:6-phosphogluconolactonase